MRALYAALFGILMAGGGYWYAHHQGYAACTAEDQIAGAQRGVKVASAQGAAGEIVKEEAKTHADTIAAPVAPVATLSLPRGAHAPRGCSGVPAAPAGPLADADPLGFIRITGPSGHLLDDINAHFDREVRRAREADATIEGLRDYALRVCPPPK